MTHLWNPEQTLEPPLALELIREQFPELTAINIRLLGAGWDNTAFVINEDLIFRFPRREIALPLLEAEWCILPTLAPLLPLPIPVPKWRGSPTSRFPWPFIGYKMLTGFTACYANLSEDERVILAKPIARFLSHLHKTSGAVVAGCHIFGDNRSRIDGSQLIPKILKNFEELALLNLLERREELESILEKSKNLRDPITSVLVHGDFYVRHLLVNEKHQLAGVIDWGDIHLGDPAMDLSIAHSFLPQRAHQTFRDAYGEISHDTWALARLRAIYSSTMLVLYGRHSGDPVILREGLRSLKLFT